MIRFILLQNRQGKTRLSKWYVPFNSEEKNKIEYEIHRAVVSRDPRFTNFLEYRNYKIIYRRYAGLYFTFVVDVNENELSILEFIHFLVEILDSYFNNVCELDLIFHFDKVYQIIDDLIINGEISEVNSQLIIEKIKQADKLE
jgi:AP-2 complex subunit sigma-1